DSEFMQYRSPVGGGPSSKTCPRCPSHRAHVISMRTIPWLVSRISRTCAGSTGWKKLGHPVPELNFESEENSGSPHSAQTYVPSFLLSSSVPQKGASVPLLKSTRRCSAVKALASSCTRAALNGVTSCPLFEYTGFAALRASVVVVPLTAVPSCVSRSPPAPGCPATASPITHTPIATTKNAPIRINIGVAPG